MDDITEDSLPTNCIILSPEELVKLGVKLPNPVLAALPVSNTKNDKKSSELNDVVAAKKAKVADHLMNVSTSSVARNIQDQTNLPSDTNCKPSPSRMFVNINSGNDTGVFDKNINIRDDNRTMNEGTESNAKNSIEPFITDKDKMERRKTSFADDSLPSSNVILETPIKNRQRGRPKKIKSSLTNKSHVDDIRAIKSPLDHDPEIKNNLESLKGNISKNDDVESSIRLDQIVSNNGDSSTETNFGKTFPQLDDSDDQDKSQLSSPEVDKKNVVQKRGRGRPRKSIPNTLTNQNCVLNVQQDNDGENIRDVTFNKRDRASICSDRSFNEDSDIIDDNPKKVRKSRIKKYNVLDSNIDSNSDVNYDHDSDTGYKSKNVTIESAIRLNQMISRYGHSSSEIIVDTKLHELDDSSDKVLEQPQSISSDVDKKTEVQKRRRGRPRKSVSSIITKQDGPLNVHLGNDAASIDSNENSDIIKDNSEKVRKSRIKKYNILNSDTDSSSDDNYDQDLNTTGKIKAKKRNAFKNRKIIDSDSNFDSDNPRDEIILEQMQNKTEAGDPNSNSKDKIQNISIVSSAIGNNEPSIICEENKVPRKRGRPKKNSLEASKTGVSSSVPITQHNEVDDSLLTTSKRGRKRKEVNYSLLENPDLSDHESNNHTRSLSEKSTVPRKVGRPKKNSLQEYVEKKDVEYNQSCDIKIEDDGIQYTSRIMGEDADLSLSNMEEVHGNSNEVKEDSAKSSSRYRWTGNATKAITQMFHAIRDNSITDLSHDPLAGKSKRSGRSKECADDVDGFSVCMVCNETLPNPQWPEHRRNVHYNLTWRKGDLSLDLSNDTVVLKTLKQLVREQGFIKCNRCTKKLNNAKCFMSHLEMCNGVVNSSGCVTCAVCNTSMSKISWHHHCYRHHNNLAWREGDPPLNLEDQDFVLHTLNALYKAKKPFHCEKCGLQKKSVLGYLSHKSTCQKTIEELEKLKVTCEKCGTKVLPVSMDYHLKTHEEKESKFNLVNSSYFDVNVGVSGKRKAAREALQVISSTKGQAVEEAKYYTTSCDFQESFVDDILSKKLLQHSPLKCIFVDCDFSADVIENMTHHMNSCEKKPDQYVLCKRCLFWCKAESEIYEHIRAEHKKSFEGDKDVEFQSEEEQNGSEEDGIFDDEDREKKRLRLMGKQKIINQLNAKVRPLFLMHPRRERANSLLYRQAYGWMWDFCESNYNFNLYQYLRNDRPWQVLDCDILSDYLPKNSQSCDIASKLITIKDSQNNINDLNYRKLGLFEISSLYDGDITIFCGGPISALAWLPTPYSEKIYNQVLAVAVFNSMDSYYVVEKNYQEPSVIQFWNFGILDCYKNDCSEPYLLFGMAVPYGPIWHLEWCPSGCLDCFQGSTTYRLGLLAVAASDSYVYIYSIDNLPDVNNRGLIYKGEPVLILQLEYDKSPVEGQGCYATKISWSKADGHRYIAVGYSSGLVAIYDLLNESLLLQSRGNNTGTNIVFPYNSFQAHYSSITALTLSHLSGGNRFLFTGSFDRTSIYWDLSNMTKITSFKKHTIADGVWMTQWPTYLVTEDESTFNDNANAYSFYKTIRHFMGGEPKNFTFSCSGIKSLSYSDWLNSILHGSNAGEVMAQFTHRMFCSLDSKQFKSRYTKSIFSLTKLATKDISVQEIATTYDEAAKKYKVVFLDYSLNKLDDTPNSGDKKKLTADNLIKWDVREYGLQSINKVAFNPNPQACTYYAVGYQAGFLRLRWIQFVCPLVG